MGSNIDIQRLQSWRARLLRHLFCSVADHDGKATQVCNPVSPAHFIPFTFRFVFNGSCTAVLRQPTLSAGSPAAGIRPTSCTPHWEDFQF